uniref:EGF-like domain-containing protein n=1 Tax=Heterorhabditis bacteriophora TaxID=37862 RepID=A0A1I7XUU4_HETBA
MYYKPISLLINIVYLIISVLSKGITEMSGFHCMNANSMRLDRIFHGLPQKTNPPFEFSILDKDGRAAEYYELGQIFKVRLVGYVHFRGLMLQSRLCDPQGYLIGALRGGEFIINDQNEFGIGFQYCDSSLSNDSITHTNDDKKFLIEAEWKTDIDVGAVQFMLTVAVENTLYWERWRPRHGFIRPKYLEGVDVIDKLFSNEELIETNSEESSTPPPFDSSAFEEMIASEENNINKDNLKMESLVALQPGVPLFEFESTTSSTTKIAGDETIAAVSQKLFKKFNPAAKEMLNSEDVKFLNTHAQLAQSDFVELEMDLEETCLQANPCDNNGVCTVTDGKLRCDCPRGWVGEKCQVSCPPDLCSDKGECIMKTNGQIGCRCIPGTTGSRCERGV